VREVDYQARRCGRRRHRRADVPAQSESEADDAFEIADQAHLFQGARPELEVGAVGVAVLGPVDVVKTQPDHGVERSVGPGCGLPSEEWSD
jgi:hypothetical protein